MSEQFYLNIANNKSLNVYNESNDEIGDKEYELKNTNGAHVLTKLHINTQNILAKVSTSIYMFTFTITLYYKATDKSIKLPYADNSDPYISYRLNFDEQNHFDNYNMRDYQINFLN